jgi:hypothetical protein
MMTAAMPATLNLETYSEGDDGNYYVYVDAVMRGSHTAFFVDSKGELYYAGVDPARRSDGMVFIGVWEDAAEIGQDDALNYVGKATHLPPAVEAWRGTNAEWDDVHCEFPPAPYVVNSLKNP